MFTFESLFTGIGGFDIGFERAGGMCLAQVEFDPQASAVLAHHWPNVKHYKDVKDVGKHNLTTPDVLCGGFPCQDVSMAGKREGLAGQRSGLWFEFHRILTELQPRFVVIENVPGLFSSNGGRDFAVVLGGLTGVIPTIPDGGWKNSGFARGYDHLYRVAWRVLDSQYFGIPQRRRRIFIVASLGDGSSAEILFEQQGGKGDSEPRFTARKDYSGASPVGVTSYRQRGFGDYDANDQKAGALKARDHKDATDLIAYNITFCDTNGKRKDRVNGGLYINETRLSNILSTNKPSEQTLITGTLSASGAGTSRTGNQRSELDMLVVDAFDVRHLKSNKLSNTLTAKSSGGHSLNYINPVMIQDGKLKAARRLTPMECERLQGFPDGHTAVNGQSDSDRYKQTGNAVSTPVGEFIGNQIAAVLWKEIWHGKGRQQR